jgi:hypothetical protein
MRALWVVLIACACSPAAPSSKWQTRLEPAPREVTLDPPAPDDVYFFRFERAELPEKTTGGQAWDDDGLPDPVAVLFVDGKETLRTRSAADTRTPQWPGAPGANFHVPASADIEIVVEDADGLGAQVMGKVKSGPPTGSQLGPSTFRVELGGGSWVELTALPARALVGLGFDYVLDQKGLLVREVLQHGPAARAGLVVGDRIIQVAGKDLRGKQAREVKSAINAVGKKPADFVAQHEDGTTKSFKLSVGPIYPLYEELGTID